MSEEKYLSAKDLLKPENMIMLYARGAFPMADDDGKLNWFMPEIRTVIPLNSYNIPRSLKKYYYNSNFEYRFDTATIDVINNCAGRETTWISSELKEAYNGLINNGYLHSVEVFQSNDLVGGLYGVSYKGAFFGESMFSKVSQASKCALVKLIERLNEKGFTLLDVQYQTEHLQMFGAKEITLEEFAELLVKAYQKVVSFD